MISTRQMVVATLAFAVAWSGIDRGGAAPWSGPLDSTAPTPRTEAIGMQAEAAGMHDSGLRLAQAGVEPRTPEAARGYYLGLVDYKISTNWNPVEPKGKTEAKVVVAFRVLRSGYVIYLAVETSSGDAALDRAALDAIWKSTPLPPFPNSLSEPYLDLRYTFAMERG